MSTPVAPLAKLRAALAEDRPVDLTREEMEAIVGGLDELAARRTTPDLTDEGEERFIGPRWRCPDCGWLDVVAYDGCAPTPIPTC